MAEIIPAILPHSLEVLREQLIRLRGNAPGIQIDVVDGIYAPNTTWPYDESRGRIELPFANEFAFEIDIMAAEPEYAAEMWRSAGAKRIIIHQDSSGAREALMALRFEREEHKKPEGLRVGIALPSTARPDALAEFENLYEYVQVMGIEKVGFQGQPFDSRAVELVRSLRQQFPAQVIQVDGGVNEDTIRTLVEAGANRLVVGSRIMESNDPIAEIKKLEELANTIVR